tara:strand:- start:79 stop:390 length:312 start_codon:yes stop_codon:yes gene_type:complete
MATPITWNEANFNWDNNPHTWDEVQLVIEVVKALGGGGVIEEDMPWMKNQDTKKRLVKLICKVQGKTIKEEKEIQNYKVKISDIKLLAEKVLGIEVLTENVKF